MAAQQTREEWAVTIKTNLGTFRTEYTISDDYVETLKTMYDVVKVERVIHVLDF